MANTHKPPLSKELVQKVIDERLAAIIEKEIAQEKNTKKKDKNEKTNKHKTNKNEKTD